MSTPKEKANELATTESAAAQVRQKEEQQDFSLREKLDRAAQWVGQSKVGQTASGWWFGKEAKEIREALNDPNHSRHDEMQNNLKAAWNKYEQAQGPKDITTFAQFHRAFDGLVAYMELREAQGKGTGMLNNIQSLANGAWENFKQTLGSTPAGGVVDALKGAFHRDKQPDPHPPGANDDEEKDSTPKPKS